jgi:dihydroorotate dehydrogenase (fumarate)
VSHEFSINIYNSLEEKQMTYIDSIAKDFPVGNAAGWCKSVDEVDALARSAAQFIVFGSITTEERAGNPGNTFDGESLNSLGLPNPGIENVRKVAPQILDMAHEESKPVILSIAGFSPMEYVDLASAAVELGFDGIEINLGCPNVVDSGERKPIFSFDLQLIEAIVSGVKTATEPMASGSFISVKLSPMSNPETILATAAILAECGINAVVTQNTFPNALLYNRNGSPVIQTPDNKGWAGLAGPAVKAMALGQVSQWRAALDDLNAKNISVWGVGGVKTGQDVKDILTAGADIVQVGTAYFTSGARIFGDIANQIINPQGE